MNHMPKLNRRAFVIGTAAAGASDSTPSAWSTCSSLTSPNNDSASAPGPGNST